MTTSKELLEMANLEWKNREERKGTHNQLCIETRRIAWTSGWISGYLTRNQPYNPQAEREKVLDELGKWCDDNWFSADGDNPEGGTPVVDICKLEKKIAELRQVGE